MLDVRPYQQIKGERRVPSFTAAQSSLPFLRFKKPQPLNLTRVIWQKLEQKSRRIDHESILANYYMPLAEAEDIWDGIVERTLVNEDVVADWRPRTWTGGGEAWRSEDAWTWTYREGLRDVRGRLWRTRAQALDMGRRMQEVVEREEALAEEEMRQREEKAIEVTL